MTRPLHALALASLTVTLPALAELLSETNAVLLFAATLGLGIVLTFAVPKSGFIGMADGDAQTVRRLSVVLLALAVLALVWAIAFKDNIRLGGGLPFIVLNVTRRMLIRRAAKR